MAKNESRQVKIYAKYRTGQSVCLGAGGKEVPWLNVSGEWLRQAGFGIGERVEITVNQHELIIKPLA